MVADGSNQTYGVDGNVSIDDIFLSGYYAETRTQGLTDDDHSYRASFSYNGDLWRGSIDHLRVGDNFSPEVGFLRRWDFRQTAASLQFSPRPESDLIRRLSFRGGIDYLENGTSGFVESRELRGSAEVEFESSDGLNVSVTDRYEFLSEPFRISGSGGVEVEPGRYSFREVGVGLTFGQQRWYSGNLFVPAGGVLHRRQDDRRGARAHQCEHTPLARTHPLIQLAGPARGFVQEQPGGYARELRFFAAHVLRRARAVQLGQRQLQHQPSVALGVSPWERAVRRLHGIARHGRARQIY